MNLPSRFIKLNLDKLNLETLRDRTIKIQCRTAYERKALHELADQKGIAHATQFDYTKIHINTTALKLLKREDWGDDDYHLELEAVPFSYVHLGCQAHFKTKEIGSKAMLPAPFTGLISPKCSIRQEKASMREAHRQLNQHHGTLLSS